MQRMGEFGVSVAVFQIEGMDALDACDLAAHIVMKRSRKERNPIFFPLSITNTDLRLIEINIGDAEANRFGDAESATVHETNGKLFLGRNVDEDASDLILRQDERESSGLF